ICMLTFSEQARPSANELVTLLYVTSKHEPTYNITNTQCYWFIKTVFEALKSLFEGAEKNPADHQGGTWNGVPIPMKGSIDEVCTKYQTAWAALAQEVEQKCRVKQQVTYFSLVFIICTYNILNRKKKNGGRHMRNVRLQKKSPKVNMSNARQQRRKC
ncbi:hypothetical protein EDC04DRAFT_2587262, partial [Pisolithus marmoratus]